LTKNSAKVFDRNWGDYEDWFERHKSIYSSELKALKKLFLRVLVWRSVLEAGDSLNLLEQK
jgi:hypothetical protein